MRQGCSGNRSRGGQARKPAKNEASRIEGCEIRDLSRVETRLASAPLAVKSRFSRGFWISTLIRYHYPGRERLRQGLVKSVAVPSPCRYLLIGKRPHEHRANQNVSLGQEAPAPP